MTCGGKVSTIPRRRTRVRAGQAIVWGSRGAGTPEGVSDRSVTLVLLLLPLKGDAVAGGTAGDYRPRDGPWLKIACPPCSAGYGRCRGSDCCPKPWPGRRWPRSPSRRCSGTRGSPGCRWSPASTRCSRRWSCSRCSCSSRHLVVGGRLGDRRAARGGAGRPGRPRARRATSQLAGTVALVVAALLVLARVARLGFLAELPLPHGAGRVPDRGRASGGGRPARRHARGRDPGGVAARARWSRWLSGLSARRTCRGGRRSRRA